VRMQVAVGPFGEFHDHPIAACDQHRAQSMDDPLAHEPPRIVGPIVERANRRARIDLGQVASGEPHHADYHEVLRLTSEELSQECVAAPAVRRDGPPHRPRELEIRPWTGQTRATLESIEERGSVVLVNGTAQSVGELCAAECLHPQNPSATPSSGEMTGRTTGSVSSTRSDAFSSIMRVGA